MKLEDYWQECWHSTICPICGKAFIPAPQHQWKIGSWGFETRNEFVCSYTCMRKWEKEMIAKDKEKKKRKYVRRNAEEG